ncbi:MAG: response regulator [Candidatus Bathyarchaeia archaeon]
MPDRIVVVDDEVQMVEAAKMVLEGEGYQVISASNGDETLLKVDAEMPDLILLDMMMPGKSGLEVCRILKGNAKTKHIPVVMFTALGRDVDRKLTAEAGADGHFMKPFTPEALVAEVKKQLDRARAEKFSGQLGIEPGQLRGKKLLFEFDPSAPYERCVRDYVLECLHHGEVVVVFSKKGNAVRTAVEGEKGVEFFDVTPGSMLSPILEKHRDKSLSLVYDSLTDLALSTDMKTAYAFARNAIELISKPTATAIFLINPSAHDPKDTASLRGLLSSQVTYGKQGITNVRLA